MKNVCLPKEVNPVMGHVELDKGGGDDDDDNDDDDDDEKSS